MKLIVILAAMSLQWYFGFRYTLKDFDWFTPYASFLKNNLEKFGVWKGYLGIGVIILPILIGLWLLCAIFHGLVFNLFGLLISIALFWYCVDARNFQQILRSYFLGNKAENEIKGFVVEPLPKTKAGLARKVSNTIFIHSLHNIFSIIFWYLILGLPGLVIYFLLNVIIDNVKELKKEAKILQDIFDWIPVRLAGLSFALMGSFGAVFVYWMKNIVTGIEKAEELITHYGLIANGANPRESKGSDYREAKEAAELVFRSVVVWLVLLAAVTFASLL